MRKKPARWNGFWAAVLLAAILTAGCQMPMGKGGLIIDYFYTQTDDGINLALRRYRPAQLADDSDKDPVIICHGLGYNLLFWDLDKSVSLPRYLAQNGYDVWSLSLRGATPSSQPLNSFLRRAGRFNFNPQVLATLQKRLSDLKMLDWSVDNHIKYDVPAAIRFVKQQTQHNQVHWIGHSMGGMIMCAYLETTPAEQTGVNSFVGLGVPVVVFAPLSAPMQFLLDSQTALGIGSKIMGSSSPATLGVIFGDMGTPMDKLFYNKDNISEGVLRLMFLMAEEEISPSQFKQLLNMVRTERFKSLDEKVDYTACLAQITTPTCLIAGTVDNMASTGAVRYAYRQIASKDKQFDLFGRVNSDHNDYGHNDLVIGRYAAKEVYPVIRKWLEKHPRHKDIGPLMLQPKPVESPGSGTGDKASNNPGIDKSGEDGPENNH